MLRRAPAALAVVIAGLTLYLRIARKDGPKEGSKD
jgi:hypothetical protein